MRKFFIIGFLVLVSPLTLAKSIVVLGDSISASYGFEAQYGWVALLKQKLKSSHPEYTIVNASISGDTTAGGLARSPQLLQQYKPEIVLLELGANDGLRGMSLKKMQQNLSIIIEQSEQSGAKVLLLSMRIPSNYGTRYTDMFYDSFEKVAKQHNITLVPFILQDIALDKSLMQHDGLHPNQKAQAIIEKHIFPYLLPLL